MNNEKQLISKEKFEEIKQELEFLKTEKRKEIAEQLEYARSLGDLSENAEYKEAREMQSIVESRIQELEQLLLNVEIIKENLDKNEVNVGCVVVISKYDDNNSKREYKIVAPAEANIKDAKISYDSPLGKALMGKKKGEVFEFESPGGIVKYKIIDIK